MKKQVKKIKEIIKYSRLYIRYIYGKIYLHFHKLDYNIMSINDSLEYIIKNKCSVIRFGDGEFMYINGKPIVYQEINSELTNRLKNCLNYDKDDILICIPGQIMSRDDLVCKSKWHWTYRIAKDFKIYSTLDIKRRYGNTNISRPYIVFKDKSNVKVIFDLLKELWNEKNILLVEGEYSRTGVGNDLFDNAKSLNRIICPAENAYRLYNNILTSVIKNAKKIDNLIILLAIGPTAKPLCMDLTKNGLWTIDIGHLDSEYEWFLRKETKKVLIRNKHTADTLDSTIEDCLDIKYLESILEKVEDSSE